MGKVRVFEVGVCVRHVGWLQGTWGRLRWECVRHVGWLQGRWGCLK